MPQSGSPGRVVHKQRNDQITEQSLLNRICVLLAGRNAERLVLGSSSTGCRRDYSEAKEIAEAMVKDYAMGEIGSATAEGFLKQCDNLCKQTLQAQKDALLMLTDVLLEGTRVIYLGDRDTIEQAFSVQAKENTFFLPGVMSRKKQVIPMLSALWG